MKYVSKVNITVKAARITGKIRIKTTNKTGVVTTVTNENNYSQFTVKEVFSPATKSIYITNINNTPGQMQQELSQRSQMEKN